MKCTRTLDLQLSLIVNVAAIEFWFAVNVGGIRSIVPISVQQRRLENAIEEIRRHTVCPPRAERLTGLRK